MSVPFTMRITKDPKTGGIRFRIDVDKGRAQDLVLLGTASPEPDGSYRGVMDPEDALVLLAGPVLGGSYKKLGAG